MIPAAQITRRADADNVPAQTVERDYVLAHAVAAISTSAEQNILVFKGGTALRLCHFDESRDFFDLGMLFSEFDVDPQEAELLFREKAQHRGINPESFSSRLEARIDEYRRRWEIEIADHVSGSVPYFEELERSVRRHLRRARLL